MLKVSAISSVAFYIFFSSRLGLMFLLFFFIVLRDSNKIECLLLRRFSSFFSRILIAPFLCHHPSARNISSNETIVIVFYSYFLVPLSLRYYSSELHWDDAYYSPYPNCMKLFRQFCCCWFFGGMRQASFAAFNVTPYPIDVNCKLSIICALTTYTNFISIISFRMQPK